MIDCSNAGGQPGKIQYGDEKSEVIIPEPLRCGKGELSVKNDASWCQFLGID